jgi:hypothetical protein
VCTDDLVVGSVILLTGFKLEKFAINEDTHYERFDNSKQFGIILNIFVYQYILSALDYDWGKFLVKNKLKKLYFYVF